MNSWLRSGILSAKIVICQGDLSAKDLSSDVQFVLAEKLFLCFVILWFEVCATQFLILWNSWCNRQSNNNYYWELCSQTGSCFATPHTRKSKIVNNNYYCNMQLPEKFTLQLVVRAVIRIKLALQPLFDDLASRYLTSCAVLLIMFLQNYQAFQIIISST